MTIATSAASPWCSSAALVLALALIGSCTRELDTPAARIRALLAEAEVAAEAKEIRALERLVSERYADELGQDKRALTGLLAYYLLRNQSIYLFTRVQTVTLPEPKRAEITVLVGMAGQPVESAAELAGLSADLYRFDFVLIDEGEGDWKVTRAAWRPAELADFR
jgi:hypothetical protein